MEAVGEKEYNMAQPNSESATSNSDLDIETLQEAISGEYRLVIEDPREDFHFHTGRPLARKLDYPEDWVANLPLEATGNQASGHRSQSYVMASR